MPSKQTWFKVLQQKNLVIANPSDSQAYLKIQHDQHRVQATMVFSSLHNFKTIYFANTTNEIC